MGKLWTACLLCRSIVIVRKQIGAADGISTIDESEVALHFSEDMGGEPLPEQVEEAYAEIRRRVALAVD